MKSGSSLSAALDLVQGFRVPVKRARDIFVPIGIKETGGRKKVERGKLSRLEDELSTKKRGKSK